MSDAISKASILANLAGLLSDLEAVYKDLHAHPELSMQEKRTAGLAADRLRAAGYEVTTGIGNTGVVGLLRNGEGPTVMLRADMDALPVQEATGLPYASKVTATDSTGKSVPVMHACGHDMHVTWLIGAATLFAKARDAWKGTLMPVFQPAEETAAGARAMIDDGLFKRFSKPDVVLGQHVMVGSSGVVSSRAGVVTSAGDSLQIRMFGRGAHGSMPEASIDPVVMAAATVMRLQTIVSREVAANEAAVVTIGVLQAGTKENVIPDEALIKLNVRTFDEGVRKRVLAAIERIVNAEAAASGAPKKPEITPLDRYSLVTNDPQATKRDGWLRAENDEYAIGYYTKDDFVFYGDAAMHWTVFQRYFSATMAGTFPNRIYQYAAQTDRAENTLELSTLPTIFDLLAAAGRSARYYYSDVPFLALWGVKYLPISRLFPSFLADCASGDLPDVAFVDPRFLGESQGTAGDDHPFADIRNGQAFINQVYTAVTNSPAWRSSVLIINYDEWGGFFDHVPPSEAPDVNAAFALRGFRVPAMMISSRPRRRASAPSRTPSNSRRCP